MKTVNVAELDGVALDWAVAGATGYDVFIRAGNVYQSIPGTPDTPCFGFRPSVRWDQGGPLIAANRIEFYDQGDSYTAVAASDEHENCFECGCVIEGGMNGPDHLIAACRAIVAAKLGDTVEVPEELL